MSQVADDGRLLTEASLASVYADRDNEPLSA